MVNPKHPYPYQRKNQLKGNIAFVKKNDFLINKELRSNKYKSKIIRIHTNKKNYFLSKIDNSYFSTETNQENLIFVLEKLKKFKINKNLLISAIQKFKGLKYRQQIIFKKKILQLLMTQNPQVFHHQLVL